MRSNPAPRLRRIGLVMLLCIAVLAGFLGYWLRSEYRNEKTLLQKNLRQLVSDTRNTITDSLIVTTLIRPLELNIRKHGGFDTAKGGFDSIAVRSTDTGTLVIRSRRHTNGRGSGLHLPLIQDSTAALRALKGRSVFAFSDSDQIISFQSERFRQDSALDIVSSPKRGSVSLNRNFSITSSRTLDSGSPNDSFGETMTRSVRLLVNALSKTMGGIEDPIANPDSAELRKAYVAAAGNAGFPVKLHWEDSLHASSSNIGIDAADPNGRLLMASSYESYLVRQMSPQILFSLFLLCLMALAFGTTYRALRSQIQLATIRNDFISNMSHELKTPVSTVKVALEAISEPEVLRNTELASEYLQMANLELGRLELLVNQALQSALLEGGRLHTDRQEVDLAALSEQMKRIMQGRFAQQGGSIRLRLQGESFIVIGDALHLQGVVVNILDNALKYAGPEPTVEIEVQERSTDIRLRITDHGPGIPAQYRPKVFEKFFRVPTGNEHNVKGYGLGLNYAAQILRIHNGTIGVSETSGGGCSFELVIPKSGS